MVIENSVKFYEDLAKGKSVISNEINMQSSILLSHNFIPEYIICDPNHFEYFQHELRAVMLNDPKSKVIATAVSILGYPCSIISRIEAEGINVYAKLNTK